jgi:hypothetical protein
MQHASADAMMQCGSQAEKDKHSGIFFKFPWNCFVIGEAAHFFDSDSERRLYVTADLLSVQWISLACGIGINRRLLKTHKTKLKW